MKTTLVVDDGVMAQIKAEAARRGRTLSELVEGALRLFLARADATADLPDLPSWRGGRAAADLSDRDALDAATDDR